MFTLFRLSFGIGYLCPVNFHNQTYDTYQPYVNVGEDLTLCKCGQGGLLNKKKSCQNCVATS